MKFEVKHIRLNNDKKWPHNEWLVTVNGESFQCRTGLGIKEKPTQNMVLESLFLDASCGQESFNDFCDNLGYSNDSIKAFDNYRQCMENAKKLRKALGNEYNTIKESIENQS